MAEKNSEDIQFTLTCKDLVDMRELKNRLYKFFKPLHDKKIKFGCALEISPKLRYHVHGWFHNLTHYKEINMCRMRLFSWQKRYGFCAISNGKLEDWIKYCLKGPVLSFENEEYKKLKPQVDPAIFLDQFAPLKPIEDDGDDIVYPARTGTVSTNLIRPTEPINT